MRITDLNNAHQKQDIYIVGTGPSSRVFPLRYLKDKITIGLNQAWKLGQWRYMITVHGELYLDWKKKGGAPTKWCVSSTKPPLTAYWRDEDYYVFLSKNQLEWLYNKERPDALLVLHGIHNTAIHLARQMGARNIFLIGCDFGVYGGDHHAHEQHVKYHGRKHVEVFADMLETSRVVRAWVRKKGGNLFNLSTCLGPDPCADYEAQREELGLEPLPTPEDTSDCLWYRGPQEKL